jgi:hypothetical protein
LITALDRELIASISYWNFWVANPLTAITAPSSAFTGD